MSKKHGAIVESTWIEDHAFDVEYQRYQRDGYALDSTSNYVLGDVDAFEAEKRKGVPSDYKAKKRKKPDPVAALAALDDEEDDNAAGPWAAYEDPVKAQMNAEMEIKIQQNMLNLAPTAAADAPPSSSSSAASSSSSAAVKEPAAAASVAESSTTYIVEPEEEDEMWEKKNERKLRGVLPPRPARGSGAVEAKSVFHGSSLLDYQGRSWMKPPAALKSDGGDHACFIPKKCTKKLAGHTKGVQAIEFFPNTGHLLLSASMDSKCKIWDTSEDFKVRRTFSGHSEGVRSVQFSNTGEQFLSSGFDRFIRLWDVETGSAAATFSNRKMAYCVKFYPRDNHLFIAACSDNKIYQWDTRTGQVCQEYNYHLQPCNTVTFFDEGRKFISTSDDKKILVWEFDIPVPLKYIAEPDMHCIPSVTVHPSQTALAGQSMDNKIVVYSCGDKVRQLKKKTFTGHNNSGYACQIGFSPNGQFLMSGDGLGQLHFWDWKSCKSYRKLQAHDGGPCMGALWHPIHPSMVATCGYDGLVKIWD